jgi:uncharacterized protein (TIGR02452 family)
MSYNRYQLKEIFDDTYKTSKDKYPYENEFINFIPSYQYIFKNTKTSLEEIIVTKNDCLDDCYQDIYDNKKVLLINSASMLNIGGGVIKGSSAQEESLCRRTNLYMALEKVDNDIKYPLFDKTKGIYTPNITVFKNRNYKLIKPFNINILSIFSRPVDKIKTELDMKRLNKNIFETIFYVCNEQKIDTLVIVPIGCGAFHHDPNEIAKTFDWYLKMIPLITVKKIIVSCFTNEDNYKAFLFHLK